MCGIEFSLAISRLMEARLTEENVAASFNPCRHSLRQIFNLCMTDQNKLKGQSPIRSTYKTTAHISQNFTYIMKESFH